MEDLRNKVLIYTGSFGNKQIIKILRRVLGVLVLHKTDIGGLSRIFRIWVY